MKNEIKNKMSVKILGLVKNICWINNSFLKNILPKTARQNKNIIKNKGGKI